MRLAPTLLLAVAVLSVGPGPSSVEAQRPDERAGGPREWNDAEALSLVELGRAARLRLVEGEELETYQALTEGHIYFFVDPEEGERALIRVDQVAVELRWQAPDVVRQRIVGERSEARLPVRDFRYYLDRLTLVQYGFGDEIQIGSGLDVAGVPHPLAPLPDGDPAREPYDFRVADSLRLSLPGESEPLRLTALEVRPRNPDRPGIMGRILLDRASGSIVRMGFSFTPASYVDPRTDRIEVEVDYGLWEGRYWLPNRQLIEVRRELPELDLGVGTVIRAVLQTTDYEFNVSFPPEFRQMPPVTWVPEEEREDYPFEEGLLEGLERHGLSEIRTRVDPREVRARAVELLRNRPPTGMASSRFHLPRISSALRYNRSEGLFLGMGGTVRPSSVLRIRGHGGYAVGMERAEGHVSVDGVWGSAHGWELRVGVNEIGDLGLRQGSDPLLSSLGALVRGEDYMDPFRTSGVEATLRISPDGPWRVRGTLGVRRDRSLHLAAEAAPLDGNQTFRPVRPVMPGDFVTGSAATVREVDWPSGGLGQAELALAGLTGREGSGVALEAEFQARWSSPTGARELEGRAGVRRWLGDPLPQGHRLLGGRGTVPGYPFRLWAGQALAMVSMEGAVDLAGPLLRLRGGFHAGWAGEGDPGVLESWDAEGTGGIRPSVTLGLGLGWDALRLQMARGLKQGEWQLLLSVDPRWWDYL